MAMTVSAKYVIKTQELVELEDLNKAYINVPFIFLSLKVDFEGSSQFRQINNFS